MAHETFFKKGATALKLAKRDLAKERKAHEESEKAKVRRRDKGCRFPLCGCRRLGLALKASPEVSHDKHKAMGGNPSGDRSMAAGMIQLCKHRHQDGFISRHKGGLRVVFLTDQGFNGPVEWQIDLSAWFSRVLGVPRKDEDWWTIATEVKVNQWKAFGPVQLERLQILAEMEM